MISTFGPPHGQRVDNQNQHDDTGGLQNFAAITDNNIIHTSRHSQQVLGLSNASKRFLKASTRFGEGTHLMKQSRTSTLYHSNIDRFSNRNDVLKFGNGPLESNYLSENPFLYANTPIGKLRAKPSDMQRKVRSSSERKPVVIRMRKQSFIDQHPMTPFFPSILSF